MLQIKKYFDHYFYRNTPFLNFLGIFVVGDLVILPFLVIGLIFFFYLNSWLGSLLFWCTYMGLRHFGEVVFWISKQAVKDKYRPPFFGSLSYDKVQIIYQVINLFWSAVYFSLVLLLLFKISNYR